MKDTIMLPVGKTCHCGEPIAQIFHLKYGKSNGIIGPGSHTPSWIVSEYACSSCGQTYIPTLDNGFSKGVNARQIKAESLLRKSYPYNTVRDLLLHEIYCAVAKGGQISFPTKDGIFLEKDTLVRVQTEDSENMTPLDGKPFILPGKAGLMGKLIFWKEFYYQKKKLSKKAKNAIEKTLPSNLIDASVFFPELVTTSLVMTKAKPLSKRAVPAVCAIIPSLEYRMFYIPKEAIGR